MATLDVYDPEGFVKWHHFAFRADAARVAALQAALESWISWRDRAPLEQFCASHREAWDEKLYTATIEVDRSWFAPLVAHAGLVDVATAEVERRIDALGPRMPRLLHRDVLAFPERVARLARLRELDAGDVIIENELYVIRRTLDLEPLAYAPLPVDELSQQVAELSFRELFEDAIDAAIGDPWAENAGFWRMYGALFDELPFAGARSLLDPSWPVHHENLDDAEPYVYGFDGFPISIVDGDSDTSDVEAFEPSPDALHAFAVDRVIAQLQADGIDVYADDHEEDDLVDDEELAHGIDVETVARRKAQSIAPDRVRFSVAAVTHEWRTSKARFVAALRDAAAGRCVLLQWNAKHPAL